jgi:hypothetical protein
MRPKGYKQSRGQRQAISQGMQAYHARVREAMAHYPLLNKAVRLKKSTEVKDSPRFTATFGAVVILVVFGVVAAVMLIAAREPTRVDVATVEPQLEKATVEAQATKPPATRTPSEGAVPVTRLPGAVTPANAPQESAAKPPAIRTLSVVAAPPTRFQPDSGPASAAHESAPNVPVPSQVAVTMTGCLERRDETFRLKDATGVDAPKSRSWRSGFLKKGSASIEVVDTANRLKLTDHIGQRVSVTGMIVDREIQAHSLLRVATSCSS